MRNDRTARAGLKHSLAQSDYITAAWTWFMVLAGKAAEPILVMSVLYASVKLLPIIHFPPPFDVAVFIAQFVALDIGGLSLNKLADQAHNEGNDAGATHARRLSIALVTIMLVGVVLAGVNQVVSLDSHVNAVIDTVLLIARAVMAVLYSRVIHSLQHDGPETDARWTEEEVQKLVAEPVKAAVAALHQEVMAQLVATLSQQQDERLTELDAKQAAAMNLLKAEQIQAIAEITETVLAPVGAARKQRTPVSPEASETRGTVAADTHSSNMRFIAEAPSRKMAEREIDAVIWPLLDTGLSVRAIAAQTAISAGTVGRSRKRWVQVRGVSAAMPERDVPLTAETV